MGSLTVRVEKATSDLLIGPDWTMNMDICDSINSDHWQAKDAVKAVNKRLLNKNPKVQLLALTLLETMIKNCGDYVHFQVVEKNTLQVMIKIIRKKTDMVVRDKILVLLDSWRQAFGGPGGKYPQYFWAYDELRRSGVEFPQCSEDAAPIFTPPITHPGARHPQAGYGMPSNASRRLDEAMASEMEGLSFSSMNSIRSVMELLTDMLDALNPNDRGAIKDEVIVELVDRCRFNQKNLIQLLNSTVDENLLGQGLSLNDNLQSLLAKHDAIASVSPLPTELANSRPKENAPAAASNPVEEEEKEDDDFAQLARRHSKTKSVLSETTSMETNDLALSLNCADVTATNTAQATASTSILSDPLTLPEPPNPVKTALKEQDMIALLSSTLSISSPRTPPSVFNQTGNHIPVSPNKQGYPYVTQPSPLNQGQVTYHSYVVPWAQPQRLPHSQPQPQVPPHSQLQPQQLSEPLSRNHPQPQVQAHPHAQLQNQVQPQAQAPTYPQPQVHPHSQSQFQAHPHPQLQYQLQPQSQAQAQPQPKPSQLPSSYPPPPWEVATNSDPGSSLSGTTHAFSLSHPNTAYTPVQAVGPWQRYHSFGSRGNNAASEPNANPGSRQAVAVKQFVHPNRLFEDLIDLKNTDGELKTGGRSSSLMRNGSADGGMMSGRK